MLKEYQQNFIDMAMRCGALRFGEFKLKSGRVSPYFFNAGHFNDAQALYQVGAAYATAIQHSAFDEIDLLFGPAYKGIPLATCTATALYAQYKRNINCAFNRKEKKDHGEGGQIIGADISGNVLIIDDVITAGTAVREVLALLENSPATVKGLMIGLNRQERGPSGQSAIAELEEKYALKVESIISASDLIAYLESHNQHAQLQKMHAYMEEFGC